MIMVNQYNPKNVSIALALFCTKYEEPSSRDFKNLANFALECQRTKPLTPAVQEAFTTLQAFMKMADLEIRFTRASPGEPYLHNYRLKLSGRGKVALRRLEEYDWHTLTECKAYSFLLSYFITTKSPESFGLVGKSYAELVSAIDDAGFVLAQAFIDELAAAQKAYDNWSGEAS